MLLVPAAFAQAGFLSFLTDLFSPVEAAEVSLEPGLNSQNIALLQASLALNPNPGKGGGDITIIGAALLPESGTAGRLVETSDDGAPLSDQISIYSVHKGDTLSQIAKMFGVSVNTIVWANDLAGSVVTEGQTLTILPVSGVRHTVKKGDTLKSIALLYKADVREVAQFNDLADDVKLAIGDEIIVPDGDASGHSSVLPLARKAVPAGYSANPTARLRGVGGPDLSGYFNRPVYGGVLSQGLHGYNAVDFAANRGTTIVSAAAGTVIISRNSGWNGGYGKYVVISHANGTQTLYAHLSEAVAYEGGHVEQGQLIGYSGNTGKSTGPHLHFEVRGARNPFIPR
jgi:murein DD-endopeptidase MepM/ murein hydrolase activator NlpD